MKSKTVNVGYLARVEGEGGVHLELRDGKVVGLQFSIFESPRHFEAFLRGRHFSEAPDITARVCGICPVAYAMSAVHAMEDACGVRVDGQLRALRRLIYCGEWIESHALHVYMLHAPDFLGYADAIRMGKDHPAAIRRGLHLKKVGNEIVTLLGGREIHPVNMRIGGFYRLFRKEELAPLAEKIKWARDAAMETVRWVAGFPFPDFERDYELVALRHPDEYPIEEGEPAIGKGPPITVHQYEEVFEEVQVPHSTALHSVLKGRGAYLVGPLARFNLNFERLSPLARGAAESAGLGPQCRNPFKSIIVRSVEMVYACDEALRIIDQYDMPQRPCIEVTPRAAVGRACTEAPRGILYHRYEIDGDGTILKARIVPPTAQNQKTIEEDLIELAGRNAGLPTERLTLLCEQAIRNHDPCISCATHLLHSRSKL